MPRPWTYKNFTVFPAPLNGSGLRWITKGGFKAVTKEGMRRLINGIRQGIGLDD